MKVAKFFNTAGPIKPDIHYNVESLSRIDLEEIEMLIYESTPKSILMANYTFSHHF